jgi:acyl-CoA thioester hydrolase
LAHDKATLPVLADFTIHTRDTIRFSDTDKIGHVGNASFPVYLDTGRSELTHGGNDDLADDDCHFVLARVEIDYVGEINWPGEIVGGLRVLGIGNSSILVDQALFQNGVVKAQARSTIVQVNRTTRMSEPLSERAKTRLALFKAD